MSLLGDWDRVIGHEKELAGPIPNETCPLIDTVVSILKDVEYLQRNGHRYATVEDLLRDLPDIGGGRGILEDIRTANKELRDLGIFWYGVASETARGFINDNTKVLLD